jgi:hypothetical protein
MGRQRFDLLKDGRCDLSKLIICFVVDKVTKI